MSHDSRTFFGIRDFLSPSEQQTLLHILDQELAVRRQEFEVRGRARSVHAIDGESVDVAKQVYEPNGRVEYDELSVRAAEILDKALLRNVRTVQRFVPTATRAEGWFYVEYSTSQYVSAHVDYPYNGDHPNNPKIAAISVTVRATTNGGEFYVESPSSVDLWNETGTIKRGADNHSPWFVDRNVTRWTTQPRDREAIVWGSELIHGTMPVESGVAGKFLAFLHA